MSNSKLSDSDRRYTFNHIDIELHTSIHAKSALYNLQNHEEYENKALPINYNSLNFEKLVNQQLTTSLYIDKKNPQNLSSEFKSNLIYFYIYYTLYLVSILSFTSLLFSQNSSVSSHFQIHLGCILLLLVFAYAILLLLKHKWVQNRVREFYLTLGFLTYMYFILADPKILYKFTNEDYNDNEIPLILGLISLGPMIRMILFDSFLYTLILGVSATLIFLCVRIPFAPGSRLTALSEIALIIVFIVVQVIETHRVDLRIKQVFWRREKEIVLKKDKDPDVGIKSLGINSDVEIIMDMCEQIKKKLKDVSRVIIYKDIKTVIKDSIADIEKIKWKIAHKQDLRIVLDPNMDDEDREYIEQNFVELKKFKSEKSDRNDKFDKSFSDIADVLPRKASGRFTYHDVEGAIATFGINWNFDIWFVYDSTGESISLVANHVLSKWNLYELFKLNRDVSQRFFEYIEKVEFI